MQSHAMTQQRHRDRPSSSRLLAGLPRNGGRRLLHFSAAKRHLSIDGLVHVGGPVPEELGAVEQRGEPIPRSEDREVAIEQTVIPEGAPSVKYSTGPKGRSLLAFGACHDGVQ
jgi:hypothetical protein